MTTSPSSGASLLRLPEFRALLGARLTNALAGSALATVVGFQVDELTRDPLALGWLGLVEAIPAIGLALLGGHLADRRDRRNIVLITSAALVVLVVLLSLISTNAAGLGLLPILAVIFLAGVASGFERPALSAFEAQVIPVERIREGSSWMSSAWTMGAIVGPALGGVALAVVGVPATYLLLAGLLAISTACLYLVSPKPIPEPAADESLASSLGAGVRFVFRSQPLWGAMALDLFAVLFGGVVALLPIFASDILRVGPVGLGLLRTAPSVGALLTMLLTTRVRPGGRAGVLLLACVAGFGVSVLVFAVSTVFAVSLVALFFTGMFDGLSVVVRWVILRLHSPEAMRGRIAAVNWVFVGASNELGAFESGVAASLLGVVPSVLAGGAVTLLVVGLVTLLAPELRRLDLTGAAAAGQEP